MMLRAHLTIRKKNGKKKKVKDQSLDVEHLSDTVCNTAVTGSSTSEKASSVSSVVISTTERNQVKNGRQQSSIDTSNCHVQKGKESIVALGLEKSIIRRWDEAEVASSKKLDSNGSVSRTIGYVGDDWDKEYDKGKRKKVKRSSISFDGLNPFQEIATKKAKLKMERKR
ncbi:Ubiquitin carboxyl-terminal hydrolase 23-like protein [Drosera capensis]